MPPWTGSWNGRKLLRLTSFPCGWKRIRTVLFRTAGPPAEGWGFLYPDRSRFAGPGVSEQSLQHTENLWDGQDPVCFTPEQAEGIRQMRQCQRLSPEAARQVAEHPREVFGSEAFDFDLGVYGDRVVSIGEFLAPDLPFLSAPDGNGCLRKEPLKKMAGKVQLIRRKHFI